MSRAGVEPWDRCRAGRVALPARGLATLSRVYLVSKSEGTPDPCDDCESTFRGLESLNLSGSPMVQVIHPPGSSAQSTALLPSHLASLPSEEWNRAPPERGVEGQAPQADGRGSRALTAPRPPRLGRWGRGGACLSPASPLPTVPPAVRLKDKGAVKGLVGVEEPSAIFNFL